MQGRGDEGLLVVGVPLWSTHSWQEETVPRYRPHGAPGGN
jgi:hypothetical protein